MGTKLEEAKRICGWWLGFSFDFPTFFSLLLHKGGSLLGLGLAGLLVFMYVPRICRHRLHITIHPTIQPFTPIHCHPLPSYLPIYSSVVRLARLGQHRNTQDNSSRGRKKKQHLCGRVVSTTALLDRLANRVRSREGGSSMLTNDEQEMQRKSLDMTLS